MGDKSDHDPERRDVITRAAKLGMIGGLAAGYGTCAVVAGRYLYPAEDAPRVWQLVAEVASIPAGASLTFIGPAGETIAIARQGSGETTDDFIALSSVCPHLGCQVHWQGDQSRFFCPCHNGVFDPQGVGIGGPPGKAGQSLARYPLKVENNLLFIQVEVAVSSDEPPDAETIAAAGGHDACLRPCPRRRDRRG